MLVAAYTFIDVFWSMLVFFLWVMWFWLLFAIWTDIFRRDDLSGWGKAGWLIFTIVLPFLGAFVYLITQNDGMNERNTRARPPRGSTLRPVHPGGRAPHERPERRERRRRDREGKELLDRGVITQAEFDVLKTNALA